MASDAPETMDSPRFDSDSDSDSDISLLDELEDAQENHPEPEVSVRSPEKELKPTKDPKADSDEPKARLPNKAHITYHPVLPIIFFPICLAVTFLWFSVTCPGLEYRHSYNSGVWDRLSEAMATNNELSERSELLVDALVRNLGTSSKEEQIVGGWKLLGSSNSFEFFSAAPSAYQRQMETLTTANIEIQNPVGRFFVMDMFFGSALPSESEEPESLRLADSIMRIENNCFSIDMGGKTREKRWLMTGCVKRGLLHIRETRNGVAWDRIYKRM